MRHIRLVATSDEYDTELGFKLKGCADFEGFMACRNGELTAHDVLEHQNGIANMGTVWDELEALGGIWQVRGRWGDMVREGVSYHSPQSNVASDITRMFSDFSCDSDFGPGWRRVGTRAHIHDEDFRDIIEIARKGIAAEYTDMGNGSPDEDENGWSPELHALCEDYLTLALHRMRVGFRKAERRFGDRFVGHSLFCDMRDAVKTAVKHIDYEGQEFRLSYSLQGDVTCTPLFEAEDY